MTRQLEAHGLLEFFDREAVIWSDEAGGSKPGPRISSPASVLSGFLRSGPPTSGM